MTNGEQVFKSFYQKESQHFQTYQPVINESSAEKLHIIDKVRPCTGLWLASNIGNKIEPIGKVTLDFKFRKTNLNHTFIVQKILKHLIFGLDFHHNFQMVQIGTRKKNCSSTGIIFTHLVAFWNWSVKTLKSLDSGIVLYKYHHDLSWLGVLVWPDLKELLGSKYLLYQHISFYI